MTKQPRNRRTLNADERKIIALSLEIAAEKFKRDANVAPANSIAVSNMRQAIDIERLAMVLAEAGSIVLEMK